MKLCNATINISYISTHTDAFSVIMIQLIFLLLFTVSPYFNIYLVDLQVVTTSDHTYSELNSVYIFIYIYLVCVFLSVSVCVCCMGWGGC